MDGIEEYAWFATMSLRAVATFDLTTSSTVAVTSQPPEIISIEKVPPALSTTITSGVAFFNELDSYAFAGDMNSRDIIQGVSLDPRIGNHYNNPSFGYGGYCLPKDTKQLLSNFKDIPQDLIKSVIASNGKRKAYIANAIIDTDCKTIGFYKLAMKKGSDNFRSSSILDVINLVKKSDKKIIVFEPSIKNNFIDDIKFEENLKIFKLKSDLIVTNRLEDELLDVLEKVFTRDIFKEN